MNKLPDLVLNYLLTFTSDIELTVCASLSKRFNSQSVNIKRYVLEHIRMRWREDRNKRDIDNLKDKYDIVLPGGIISEAAFFVVHLTYNEYTNNLEDYVVDNPDDFQEAHSYFGMGKFYEKQFRKSEFEFGTNPDDTIMDKRIVFPIRLHKMKTPCPFRVIPLPLHYCKWIYTTETRTSSQSTDYCAEYHLNSEKVRLDFYEFIMNNEIYYSRLRKFYAHDRFMFLDLVKSFYMIPYYFGRIPCIEYDSRYFDMIFNQKYMSQPGIE